MTTCFLTNQKFKNNVILTPIIRLTLPNLYTNMQDWLYNSYINVLVLLLNSLFLCYLSICVSTFILYYYLYFLVYHTFQSSMTIIIYIIMQLLLLITFCNPVL